MESYIKGTKEREGDFEPSPDPDYEPRNIGEWDTVKTEDLLSKIDISPTITGKEKEALIKLVLKYKDIFALDDKLGATNLVKYEINHTPNARPIVHAPVRLSPAKEEALIKQLTKWRKQGVIRPSKSAWAQRLVFVKKGEK
ncbi:hypothetical protein CPB86DRAFT_719717, partial [Serendipita vermifera]